MDLESFRYHVTGSIASLKVPFLRDGGIDYAGIRRFIVGLKEDNTPDFAHQACLLAHGRWAIFAGGAKETHMDMLPYGCDGYMSVFIHHKPEIARAYWSAVERRDLAAACGVIWDYDLPLFRFIGSAFAAGGDAALHGILEGGSRAAGAAPPLPNLSDEDMARLRAFLLEKGML